MSVNYLIRVICVRKAGCLLTPVGPSGERPGAGDLPPGQQAAPAAQQDGCRWSHLGKTPAKNKIRDCSVIIASRHNTYVFSLTWPLIDWGESVSVYAHCTAAHRAGQGSHSCYVFRAAAPFFCSGTGSFPLSFLLLLRFQQERD